MHTFSAFVIKCVQTVIGSHKNYFVSEDLFLHKSLSQFSKSFCSPEALIDGCTDVAPYINYKQYTVSSGQMNMHGRKIHIV